MLVTKNSSTNHQATMTHSRCGTFMFSHTKHLAAILIVSPLNRREGRRRVWEIYAIITLKVGWLGFLAALT